MTTIWFEHALLTDGWAEDVALSINGGVIAAAATGVAPPPGAERFATGLPGLPNLHSHAFQRAMAGAAEAPGVHGGWDDFWSWREAMYGLVAELDPDDVAAIAAMAYAEMLEGGFTRVGEFNYLHHDRDGRPYSDPAAMAAALAAASAEADVSLTLLPVFYAHSGFGGAEPTARQQRFACSVDGFLRLREACRPHLAGLDGAVLGIAPHSLRAVTPDEISALLAGRDGGPVHIHAAEQMAEVEACLAWSGARPVEWLLGEADVSPDWCLVHATHVTDEELGRVAASGAVVGLCPVTEANLGDGVFPAAAYLAAGGRWGVGTDSNVRIDAAEELRLLEYGQRLTLRRRNVLARGGLSTGETLLSDASAGGGQALGVHATGLAAGAPADVVALGAPACCRRGSDAVDRWIFADARVDAVWRAGRKVVERGTHVRRTQIAERFVGVMRRLRFRS